MEQYYNKTFKLQSFLKTETSSSKPNFGLVLLEKKLINTVMVSLPNFKINLKPFRKLYTDKVINSYFKGVRKLVEYPGLSEIFRNAGFDMSLYNSVKKEIPFTKSNFVQNIFTATGHFTNRNNFLGMCKINQEELNYIVSRVHIEIFNSVFPQFTFPQFEDIYNSINFTASQGLPNPFIKKRDIKNELRIHLNRFYDMELLPSEVFQYPSVIFLRSQVRLSGLKQRLVFAVQAFQQLLESFYYYYFISGVPKFSSLTLGLTQLEIQKVVNRFDNKYTYSIDYSKWDFNKQPVLTVIAFEIIFSFLPLNIYLKRILNTLRNYYITLPAFHPQIELKRRQLGTVSGSGFTSLDNSLCNWILIHICMYRYCKSKNISISSIGLLIHTCGDDLLLGVDNSIDVEHLFNIIKSDFGIIARLETSVKPPRVKECFFLGSEWRNGKPFRDERVLVASVCFGSGNFPKMSTDELLQSRFIEIFGNTSDTYNFWKRLKRPLRNRFFFFKELHNPSISKGLSLRTDLIRGSKPGDIYKSRGFWYNRQLLPTAISDLWSER